VLERGGATTQPEQHLVAGVVPEDRWDSCCGFRRGRRRWSPGCTTRPRRWHGVSQLAVSNHIFEQTGLAPTARVLDDLRTAFDTDLRQVDFADEPATCTPGGSIRSRPPGSWRR
jgi:hypothetical protein